MMRVIFWCLIAVICGVFGYALGTGLGIAAAGKWLFGLWGVWGVIFAVFIDSPLMRWVARTVFKGEIDPNPRPIKGRIVAYERGILRLKDDASTLQWKTCSLTLIHFVWIAAVNLFMVLVVIIPLASWLAERS